MKIATENSSLVNKLGHISFLLLCAAFVMFYIAWVWSYDVTEFGGDSAGYILASQYLSPFKEHSAVLTAYYKSIFYPPLFPLIIGLFGGSILSGHLVVVGSLLFSAYVLYKWTLFQLTDFRILSIAFGSIFLTIPITYFTALNIWSENTYLLFSLLAITAAEYSRQPTDDASTYHVITAIAVALAVLVRVAGLPLLGAYLIFIWLHRREISRPLALTSIAALPFLIWTAWSKLQQVGIGSYVNEWKNSYSIDIASTLMQQLNAESFFLVSEFQIGLAGESPTAVSKCLGIGIILLGLVGAIRRLWALKLDAIYFWLYMLLIFAWPHPEEAARYQYVVVPLILAYGLFTVVELSQYVGSYDKKQKAFFGWAFLAFILVLSLPRAMLTVQRFEAPIPAVLEPARHTPGWYEDDREEALWLAKVHVGLLNGLRSLDSYVPEGECIFSIKPTVSMLYSSRWSIKPPLPTLDDQAFANGLHECNFVLFLGFPSPTFHDPFYPAPRLSEEKVNFLATFYPAASQSDQPIAFIGKLNRDRISP